jgi:putative NADPH-quinone reductase
MKKILLINAHPHAESFCSGLLDAYKKGALSSGAEIKEIVIRELDFNPNLEFGYGKIMEMEPDLIESSEKIKWADHLVWIHPVWWGGLPAISKGFIDRTFLPGFAFKYRENSVWWDRLLMGKTGHIITTLDQPSWYYGLVFGKPSVNMLKRCVLEFSGIKPVKISYFGPIRDSKIEQRDSWLAKSKELGRKYL